MSNNGRETVERITIGLYPVERAIVDAKVEELRAQIGDANFSMALRAIIRQWHDLMSEPVDTTPDCA